MLAYIVHLFSLITDQSCCQALSASENTLSASSTKINLNQLHVGYMQNETPIGALGEIVRSGSILWTWTLI